MKILAYALIRTVSFILPDPAHVIGHQSGAGLSLRLDAGSSSLTTLPPSIVYRPVIEQADGSERSCMPLVLKAVVE